MTTSGPSPTPGSQKKPTTSTPSWTKPRPADIINYRYLWAREAARGIEEGAKARPCLVLSVDETPSGTVIFTTALTTSDHTGANSIALPDAVKEHLGLDASSRVIVTEYNRFVWIGPDIEPLHDGRIHLGTMPSKVARQVLSALLANRGATQVKRES